MRINYNTFTAGELSPKLQGRGDLPGAARGCFRLRNLLPRITGGVFRRPGALYRWSVEDMTKVPRLLPFNFSSNDALLIEMGDLVMRFGEDGALVGAPYEVVTPWEEDELFAVRFRQINDVIFFAHPDHPPRRLTRISNTEWEMESVFDIWAGQDPADGFAWPPMRDENPTEITLACDGTTGTATLTASDDVFDPLHEGSFFQIAHRRDAAFDELLIPVFPSASATMDFRVQPIEGQQFTISGTVYTWTATLSGAYQVEIGADKETSRDNAVAAINANTTAGGFGPGTAQNPDVEATAQELSATSQVATGILTGNGTNALAEPQADPINVVVTVGSIKYGFMNNPVDALFSGATYNVRRGATEKESLTNLVKAINATGVYDVDYHGATTLTAHPDVTAALTADNQVTITAKVAGTSGNSIVTVTNNSSVAIEPLTWGSATLTGGGGSESFRLKVEAREVGTSGNDITLGGMLVAVLSSSDAGVTNVSNNNTVTLGAKTYTFKTALTPAANEVLIGADWDASLLNLIRAMNLTGTPGTDYGAATTINADVFAAAAVTADHKVLFASKTVNPTSSIATTETGATTSFGAATMQPQWNSTSLTGGSDVDLESAGFEVLGDYKIWSYGLWKGTVVLERQRQGGSWETLRQWRGNNDRNIAEEGVAEYPQTLRLRVIDGTGTSSADVDAPRFVVEATDSRIFGLVRIDTYVSPTVVDVTVIKALHSTDATTQWSEGSWSDFRGYPNGLTVHNQRLVFLGNANEPQTMWFSATADFLNFRRGLNDSDGFVRTIAGDESSPILWGISLGAGIIIGKESEEWLGVSSDGQASITPTNFQAKRQSTYGTADVDPVVVGSNLLFVKAGGRNVLVYQFAYEEQNFFAADLAELSDHLLIGRIKQIAYSRKPENILWIVTHDGKLLSMSYQREKEFLSWAYHPMDGTVESVAVVNGSESIDSVFIATYRTIGGQAVRYVEQLDMQTMLELDSEDIDEASQRALLTYLDCSKRQSGTFTTTCTGLSHLDGHLVSIYVDGAYHAPKVVSGGSVVLDRPGSIVLAGLDYSDNTMLVPFNIDLSGQDGATAGKKWKIGQIDARFYNSSAGRHANHFTTPSSELFDIKFDSATDEVNTVTPVTNGIIRLCQAPRYQDDARVVIKAKHGEPLNVLALTVDAAITGP